MIIDVIIDSEKIKKALDVMDNANLQKEYNPIASQKQMEMMLKTTRPYLYRKYKEWQKENVK